MQIQIQFISATVENKGKYNQAEIAYKDLAQGKVTSKKLMSFNNPIVYKTMVDAKNGELYVIEMQKNDKGYWDWIKVETATGVDTAQKGTTDAAGSRNFTSPKSTYETPEERAKKQVYIVRQSSISAAIETLKTDKKNPTVDEVLSVAREYEAYVFGAGETKIVSLADLPPNDTDEDIPV